MRFGLEMSFYVHLTSFKGHYLCVDLRLINKPWHTPEEFFQLVGLCDRHLRQQTTGLWSNSFPLDQPFYFLLLFTPSALPSHQDHNTLTNRPLVSLENRTPPAFLPLH